MVSTATKPISLGGADSHNLVDRVSLCDRGLELLEEARSKLDFDL